MTPPNALFASNETNKGDFSQNEAAMTLNRETSFQVVQEREGQPVGIAPWHEGGMAILSLFVLEGEGILISNGEPAQVIRAAQHILYRVPDTIRLSAVPHGGSVLHAVAFQFSDSYLRQHCPEQCPNLCRLTMAPAVAGLQPLGMGEPAVTGTELRTLVRQVCEARMPAHLQPVYRDIKIAEILLLQLEEILYGEGKDTREAGLREHEVQRVYHVRDILRNNLGKQHTLLGLAREAGTNDATLKKQFKQVLGCTVFGYLTACRMETAKTLLAGKDIPIAEIAQELGYKQVSHFSAAFRKHYGFSPTQFREGR